jgi:hypothetical protein
MFAEGARMTNLPDRKFCPVCKLTNDADALICQHCGAQLYGASDVPTTQQVEDTFELTEEIKKQIGREHTPPSKGMSIFLLNLGEPIALRMEEGFVLGRANELTSEPILDLTPYEGFAMGVSRRHAQIRAAGDKYVIIDLNSSNGTWLNGQRLVPTKPYDLRSGSVIQLGRLKLIVSYLHPPTAKPAK